MKNRHEEDELHEENRETHEYRRKERDFLEEG